MQVNEAGGKGNGKLGNINAKSSRPLLLAPLARDANPDRPLGLPDLPTGSANERRIKRKLDGDRWLGRRIEMRGELVIPHLG
jgi:hypothetical protein